MAHVIKQKTYRQGATQCSAYCVPRETHIPTVLFAADAGIDGDGKFRFQLSREDVQVTKRLRLSRTIKTDKKYMPGLRYTGTKYFSVSTQYDSDMGLGVGITFSY